MTYIAPGSLISRVHVPAAALIAPASEQYPPPIPSSPARKVSDPLAQLVQLLGHTRPAVAAQAQPMLFADMGQDHHIAPLMDGRGSAPPRAQPAIDLAAAVHVLTGLVAARQPCPLKSLSET